MRCGVVPEPPLDRHLGLDQLDQPGRVSEGGRRIVGQGGEGPAETHAAGTRIGEAELEGRGGFLLGRGGAGREQNRH